MPGSGKERGGGDKGRTSAASPREAVSPGDSGRRRPRAYMPHKAPRAHAPPCGSSRPDTRLHAHAPPALRPDSRAYVDPQGQARGAAVPRGPRTRVHTLAYAHPDRGATTQRPPPRHPVLQRLAPTASRVFTPTPRSVTGGWTRGGTSPRGAQEGEVAPRPDGLPLRALPGSPVRTASRGRPPALTVGPAAAEAATAARAPARPRRCRLGRGGGSGSRGGAGGRRGWDPLTPPEAPLLPRLTPPTPRPRCRRRPPQPLTCGSSVH